MSGDSSTVTHTVSVSGENPIRATYNNVTGEMGIIVYGNESAEIGAKLLTVDPVTGAIINSLDLNEPNTGNGLQVFYDESGDPIVLTSYKMIYGGTSYDMPEKAKYMAYSPQTDVAIAISPVNDFMYLLDLTINSIESYPLTTQNFVLHQNYPNPFNPKTVINYSISQADFVSLKVYDILGNEITTLVNEHKTAGNYFIEFSAIGGDGYSLPSGIYFYRMQVGNFNDTKKFMLIK